MFWRSESSVSCPASSLTVLRLTAKRPLLCGGQGGIKLGQGSAECFASQPLSDWAFAGQDEFLDTGELCKTLRGAGAPAAAACLRRGVEGKYYLKIASGFTLTSSLRESPIAFHMPHPSALLNGGRVGDLPMLRNQAACTSQLPGQSLASRLAQGPAAAVLPEPKSQAAPCGEQPQLPALDRQSSVRGYHRWSVGLVQ